MATATTTIIQRRGSLIQRRNSKRFVLSELTATAAGLLLSEESRDRDEYISAAEDDGSDDDDVFKVPDIVLDAPDLEREHGHEPVKSAGFYIDSPEYQSDLLEWRTIRTLKNQIS